MLSQLISPISSIIDKFIPDADTKQKIAYDLATLADNHAQEIALAQVELNKIESAGNWFQSGWRPATGWVCVAGFLVNFLVSPLAAGFGVAIPQADLSVMLPVLMGMLGLGTLRTFEKTKKAGNKG
tara:strand:- start:9045 stop:9422 length:378 start_codon:yes stop_codon:yes gene_type:complete